MDKETNLLSNSHDMFRNDNCPGHLTDLALTLDDTFRAVQGISAITQILGAHDLAGDIDDGQQLDARLAFGLMMAARALSDMCMTNLEQVRPMFQGKN